MKTTAAVVYETGKPIEIEELDLDKPRDGEVLIRYTHAGLCHSDVHIAHGDLEARLPMVLGHEGAGVIEEVGPGVTRVKAGDSVVCSFIPNCGICRYCANGQQSICDMGATILEGYLPGERFPITGPRGQYGGMCMLGTFSQYGVIHQFSTVKIDPDLPLEVSALVGCGVPTGWGAAVNAADVRPGQTVGVQVTVSNRSPRPWPADADHPLSLMLGRHPGLLAKVPVPALPARTSVTLQVPVTIPSLAPGTYRFPFDIAHGTRTWFALRGSSVTPIAVTVSDGEPGVLATGPGFGRRLGEAFEAGLAGAGGLVLGVVALWPLWLIGAALFFGLRPVLRRSRARYRAQASAPPPSLAHR